MSFVGGTLVPARWSHSKRGVPWRGWSRAACQRASAKGQIGCVQSLTLFPPVENYSPGTRLPGRFSRPLRSLSALWIFCAALVRSDSAFARSSALVTGEPITQASRVSSCRSNATYSLRPSVRSERLSMWIITARLPACTLFRAPVTAACRISQ